MAVYEKNQSFKLSTNFKVKEFDCKCGKYCKVTVVHPELVEKLQKLRNHFGKPVIINSGYRCAPHNRNVGGAAASQHLFGKAADIVVKGVSPEEVARVASSIGFTGIGVYNTFTHVDIRAKKARWRG